MECGLRCDQLVARYGRAGKRALNIGVMADEGGKAVIVEVVNIGATVHFPPLASALCGPLNGLLERSRVQLTRGEAVGYDPSIRKTRSVRLDRIIGPPSEFRCSDATFASEAWFQKG